MEALSLNGFGDCMDGHNPNLPITVEMVGAGFSMRESLKPGFETKIDEIGNLIANHLDSTFDFFWFAIHDGTNALFLSQKEWGDVNFHANKIIGDPSLLNLGWIMERDL